MTDPFTIDRDRERKLATIHTLEELGAFERGLVMQGYATDHAKRIVATRRAEIEAGR